MLAELKLQKLLSVAPRNSKYDRCKPYIGGRRLFSLIETRSSKGKDRCQAKMILSTHESNLPFLKALD